MEVYARELIPRRSRASAGRAADGVRQPRGGAPPAASGTRSPTSVVPVRARNRVAVGPRRAAAFAAGSAARAGCRPRPQPREHRAAARALPARRHDPRPPLPRRPRARTSGCSGSGCACSCPPRRAVRTASSSSRGPPRADMRRWLHVPERKVDVVPLGVGASPAGEPSPPPRAARCATTSATRPVVAVGVGEAPAQEPRAAASRRSPRSRPSAGRCSSCPGYPTPHEARAARARGGARRASATCASSTGSRRGARGPLRAGRGAVVLPSLYEGFGLPVLEAMAAACRWRARIAARCRRWRATPRCCSTPRTRPRSRRAAAHARRPGASRRALRAAGRARAARFTWERTARADRASYERALGSA